MKVIIPRFTFQIRKSDQWDVPAKGGQAGHQRFRAKTWTIAGDEFGKVWVTLSGPRTDQRGNKPIHAYDEEPPREVWAAAAGYFESYATKMAEVLDRMADKCDDNAAVMRERENA